MKMNTLMKRKRRIEKQNRGVGAGRFNTLVAIRDQRGRYASEQSVAERVFADLVVE